MSAARNVMTESDLIEYLSGYISNITGNRLGAKQYTLVKSRLNKRMRDLGELSPSEYLVYLKNNESSEISALISLLTTHHSYFFREFSHFEFLAKTGLAELVSEVKKQGRKTIRIWSAGCSKGQEVYSLAMFLNYHLPLIDREMKYELFGTDVSEDCIEICKNGVYKWKEIKAVPAVYLGKHWARGTGDISDYVKAKNSIKKSVKFGVLNLLDYAQAMGNMKFDIIFCRNVFIYFEEQQIKEILGNFQNNLHSHGHVYLGLSESLSDVDLDFEHIGNSIYAQKSYTKTRKVQIEKQNLESGPKQNEMAIQKKKILDEPIKVLCVDDSPTVLKILEKIIAKNENFSLVGTAKNGLEAAEMVKKVKPDVMTLDIHMPEQNGIEYLQYNYSNGHPPVVMVSSVSREDANLGIKAFEYGAFDYIEKPSLQTISLLEDELFTKLLSAYEMRDIKMSVTELDMSFKRTPIIVNPDKKMRVIYAHVGQRERLYALLNHFRAPQPPTIVFFEGVGNLVEPIKQEFAKHTVRVDELVEHMLPELEANRIYFADAATYHDKLLSIQHPEMVSVLLLGKPSQTTLNRSLKWKHAHYVAEDLSTLSLSESDNVSFANEIVPFSSFAYESDKYLSEEAEEGDRSVA